MVRKARWLFKDIVVRRLMDDLARSSSRSLKEVAKETNRSPERTKETAKRLRVSVKSQAKKK